jgi:hypothetical protein
LLAAHDIALAARRGERCFGIRASNVEGLTQATYNSLAGHVIKRTNPLDPPVECSFGTFDASRAAVLMACRFQS